MKILTELLCLGAVPIKQMKDCRRRAAVLFQHGNLGLSVDGCFETGDGAIVCALRARPVRESRAFDRLSTRSQVQVKVQSSNEDRAGAQRLMTAFPVKPRNEQCHALPNASYQHAHGTATLKRRTRTCLCTWLIARRPAQGTSSRFVSFSSGRCAL